MPTHGWSGEGTALAESAGQRLRPTIEDVARAAGVSTSSARNYFSRPAVLSASTRERIEQAVRATGYAPRGSAGRLARGRLGGLGFELPRAEDPGVNPIYHRLLLELLWAARSDGFQLHPFVTDKEPGSRVPFYRQLWARRQVGGFLVTDAGYDDERVPWLLEAGVPFVLLSRLRDEHGYCWVDNDNVGGSVAAVDHLVEGRHRRVAYLGWPGGDPVADRRLEGYRRAVAAAGLPEVVALQDYGQSALEQAGRLLDRPAGERPTAVVASCDEFAYDVVRAATQLGLAVAGGAGDGRVAVVGCDDSPMAARTVPTLSSLRQPVRLIAERAVDLLAAKMQNPRLEVHALERPLLVVRESSSPA
jgi:DNA-binding LacI/PurR family transcriptional regulator